MKILHVIGGELNSGASIGALNLHKKLRKNNIDSFVLTNAKSSIDSDPYTYSISKSHNIKNFFYRVINFLPKIFYSLPKNISFSFALIGHDISKTEIFKKADIIHLHWVGKSMLNLNTLPEIKKPIIWTFRDMWPMTGGCHYSLSCKNYKKTCNSCPQLNSKNKNDLSTSAQNKKIEVIKNTKDIHFVTVSRWLKKKALSSKIFKNQKVFSINNTIDCDFFKKVKPAHFNKLKIDKNKKILLYGAQNIMAKYKGFEIFMEALKNLDKDKYHLLIFGKIWNFDLLNKNDIAYDYLGFIENKIILREIYSMSDIFIASSIQDAFPKSFAEAMLCETPVVCFNNNSISDVIRHKKNGYVAKDISVNDFAKGINWLAKNQNEKMKKECRKFILKNYNSNESVKLYIKLYKKILKLK
jgi:glycosyltransferase involved in cell wall biosynthesis